VKAGVVGCVRGCRCLRLLRRGAVGLALEVTVAFVQTGRCIGKPPSGG
jgi:hypothetical protein